MSAGAKRASRVASPRCGGLGHCACRPPTRPTASATGTSARSSSSCRASSARFKPTQVDASHGRDRACLGHRPELRHAAQQRGSAGDPERAPGRPGTPPPSAGALSAIRRAQERRRVVRRHPPRRPGRGHRLAAVALHAELRPGEGSAPPSRRGTGSSSASPPRAPRSIHPRQASISSRFGFACSRRFPRGSHLKCFTALVT